MGLSVFECGRADLHALLVDAQGDDEDDTPAMNEIVRRFERLTQRISRSLTRDEFLRDDLANEARIALVKAVRRHDLSEPRFAGLAETYMLGAALRERKKWMLGSVPTATQPATVSIQAAALEEEIPTEALGVAGEVEGQLAPWGDGAVAGAISRLDARQQDLVHRRYVDDAAMATLAAEAGTSVSAVSQRLATIHRRVELAVAA